MIDTAFIEELKAHHVSFAKARREVMGLANDALGMSKRAIFALHRDDAGAADALLADAKAKLEAVRGKASLLPELEEEGSYRAALEEYAEASMYRRFLKDGAVAGADLDVGPDAHLGALADLAGELHRRQVRLATDGKIEDVRRIKDAIEGIVAALLDMDLTGHLRAKFDQAKHALRRAEDVLYDLSMHRGA